MPPIVLIINPFATKVTSRRMAHIIRILRRVTKVEIVVTNYQGHAQSFMEDWRGSVRDALGADSPGSPATPIFVVFGGDGTVNEVVNGLLGRPEDYRALPPGEAATQPCITALPGGSANVFARSIGIAANPVRAAKELAHTLRIRQDTPTLGSSRRGIGIVNAGDSTSRWFLFNLGVGLDAEVVAGVEEDRQAGLRATSLRYLVNAIPALRRTRRHPPAIHVTTREDSFGPFPFLFVSCARPWTYLESLAIEPNPDFRPGTGLAFFSLRDFNLYSFFAAAPRLLSTRWPRTRKIWTAEGIPFATLDISPKSRLQVDGDYVGQFTQISIDYAPDCLTTIAPPR